MTLSFTTLWSKQMGELAGQPNYFVKKIWRGLYRDIMDENIFIALKKYMTEHQAKFGKDWDGVSDGVRYPPKLHTIRQDPHDRWKAGNKIHFVINNRTKNRFQFAPVIEVKSVQKIEIKSHGHFYEGECTAVTPFIKAKVIVDGSLLAYEDAERLAINDGFESLAHFLHYFPYHFTGKIIHWTNIHY